MMTKPTPEEILSDLLAQCRERITNCLVTSDEASAAGRGDSRVREMGHAVALLNASARVAGSLARMQSPRKMKKSPNRGSIRQGPEARAGAATGGGDG